jgi:CheY-like chemotaxis protein
VTAGVLKEDWYACVSVSDTGQGMSREAFDRAYEPFFTTKPHGNGAGLGLSMVYGFVKQSSGIVRIDSELGVGTTVLIYLPIVADLSSPIPANTAMVYNGQLCGTALVVDDELDILELALTYLKEMGFRTLQAMDGDSAFEILQQHAEIDLMIADVIMAGEMNGAELGRKACAIRPGLKVVYSSGFSAEALAERTIPLFEDPFLRKPYQKTEFTAIVHRVMGGGSEKAADLEASHRGASAEPFGEFHRHCI